MSINKDAFRALPIKERAALINTYVSGGVMDLEEMKRHYNTLDGTETEQTLSGKKPTLEEYIQHKIDSVRNAALEKSYNRKTGVLIPYELTPSRKKLDEDNVISMREYADTSFVGPSLPIKEEKKKITGNLLRTYQRHYYKALKELEDNCEYGLNCIGTATDNYPQDSYTDNNNDFRENHSNYGFISIDESKAEPGDIVQSGAHGMIYASNNDGERLFNWSSGGPTEFDYVTNGHFGLKGLDYYRYVGTPKLIQQWTDEYNNKKAFGGRILDGNEAEQTTTSESPSKKHVEDVIRTTRGATGKFILSEYPYVDTEQLRYLVDSWKVMHGNNDYIAPKDDNYTGTAIKDGKLQTDNGLGFATQKELEDKLGYIPKDFVDTYVYGDIPFEELGVFKKDVSPERHVLRSKVEKVEKSGKNIKTYQTHKDTLDSKKVAYFDKLLNEGLVDLHSRNTTTQDSPFRIGDSGIIYDGNNSTIATVYLPNGQPVSKAIDVFDTDPTEWNYNVGPLSKTGLKFIHNNTNPFIMTTPWYYPEGSSDEADRLENLFGIVIDPDDYYVYSNKGDKNGVKWTLDEAVDWIRSHPDLTETPKKSKKSKEKFGN